MAPGLPGDSQGADMLRLTWWGVRSWLCMVGTGSRPWGCSWGSPLCRQDRRGVWGSCWDSLVQGGGAPRPWLCCQARTTPCHSLRQLQRWGESRWWWCPYTLGCLGPGGGLQAAASAPGPQLLAGGRGVRLVPGLAACLRVTCKQGQEQLRWGSLPATPLPGGGSEFGG